MKRGAIAWQLHSCDSISFFSTAPCAFVCTALHCSYLASVALATSRPEPEIGQQELVTPEQLSDRGGGSAGEGGGGSLTPLPPHLSARTSLRQIVVTVGPDSLYQQVCCQVRIGPDKAMPRWFWTIALGTLAMHNTSGNFEAGDGTRHSSPAQLPLLCAIRRWLFSPGGREGAIASLCVWQPGVSTAG